jgi:hypothetical protein
MNWYQLGVKEVLHKLGTSENGLSDSEAKQRIAAFLAQLSVIYVPVFQWVFRTEPISMNEWLQILMVSATVVIVVEIDKWIRRRKIRGMHV